MIYYTIHLSQSLLHLIICLQIIWNPFLHLLSTTTNTITSGQHLNVSSTISSPGGYFELGFFSPGNSSTYFVGIWFKKASQPSIVWVANRDFPLRYSSPVLTFSPEGDLVIREERITYAITNVSSTAVNATLTLLDSGNLVLQDVVYSVILWQSFDYPSDTYLPGMKLGYDKRNRKIWSLASWKSLEDPGIGVFSMQLDPGGSSQLLIMQEKKIYWTSGSWNGSAFSSFHGEPFKKLDNARFVSNENQSYFIFSGYKSLHSTSRIMLDVSGQIKQQTLSVKTSQWVSNWSEPADQCRVYAYCGSFGGCRKNSNPFCSCLTGFIPRDPKNWNLGDMSDGCMRETPLSCNASGSIEDGFRLISPVVLPVNPTFASTGDAMVCRSRCLSNCSCSAYSHDTTNGCQTWGTDLFNLQLLSDNYTDGKSLFLKLAASDIEEKGSTWKWWVWLLLSLFLILLLILAVGLFTFFRRRRNYHKMGEDLLQFDIDNCQWSTTSSESNSVGKNEKKEVQLPLFSFSSVSTATGNFSNANKLGEGGFGPVYKGGLQKGYEVAVKRLSKKSGQGWDELKNEATLIAKLQHKNLVRILGCCLEQDENILIYEYLPNRSLDFFLFDPLRRRMLYWKTRINIIMGIAQGLLYLHEYSRLRIIHRDLKASNILLDKDMNPKISDFGLARIFGDDRALATNRIVGTYGYMSPEYAMEGLFSVKSDVFSFGILLLEILCGRRNSGLFTNESPNLLGCAWSLWKKGKVAQLMDPVLEEKPPEEVQTRYVIIALLCVQECAEDRPTMSQVTSMLSNENVILATPKLPKSSIMRSVMDGDSSMTAVSGRFSVNDPICSTLELNSTR